MKSLSGTRLGAAAAAWSRGMPQARARLDAWRFGAMRGDYYAYLAEMLRALQGRKTLLDHFEDDARRYGPASVRGRLSRHWARRYQETGGDLAAAWAGSLPADECLLIAAGQQAGGDALVEVLQDLAHVTRLIHRIRGELIATTAAGLVAACVACALLWAVPYFTVPRLQQVFQGLPGDYLGPVTRNLYALAHGVRRTLAVWVLGLPAGAALMFWSLSNFTGRLRARLDRFLFWRLYRDFHAIRFLAMLGVLLRRRGNIDTRLREALSGLAWNARPWLAAHVGTMLARIDAGIVGVDSLDTGLLDRELWWFLTDMAAAHGLVGGLQQTRLRVEFHAAERLRRQAQALRWVCLLCSAGTVIGLALWHYAAIDELRRALMQFHATG